MAGFERRTLPGQRSKGARRGSGLVGGASVWSIPQKRRNGERWSDKAGNEDETVEAEKKCDDIFERTVKGKQESDERYAVVARSREIQSNGGPSNGPASQCHLESLATDDSPDELDRAATSVIFN